MKKIIIVGGSIADTKPSSIINMLAIKLKTHKLYNGILPASIAGNDLVLWFPDIPNEEPKQVPRKDRGATMIVSKVMRKGTTEMDAISRIFNFGANAVVCIYKDIPNRFRFVLIDALGNTWIDTTDVGCLVEAIKNFYSWTKGQVRTSYKNIIDPMMQEDFEKDFIELNRVVAEKVEGSKGTRYFGNISTRCMKMFPTSRSNKFGGNAFLFSPRNSNKKKLTKEDSVLITPPLYYGDRKYSVDAPCQVAIYQRYLNINYMIHGHAYLDEALFTGAYYPCGDLRELPHICKLLDEGHKAINLINHGFLLIGESIEELEKIVSSAKFFHLNSI
jgi:ribulose-5-phosphate 4-epimerase/fuculose-1-phosphate aldolase